MNPLLLGIRHHGPGSARAVRRALSCYSPDVILIEGPPEADALIPLAGDESMRAPVALLAYPADAKDPKLRASFWPFAEFSPEWQAIRWAVAHDVPVRFIDLPAAVRLAAQTEPVAGRSKPDAPSADDSAAPDLTAAPAAASGSTAAPAAAPDLAGAPTAAPGLPAAPDAAPGSPAASGPEVASRPGLGVADDPEATGTDPGPGGPTTPEDGTFFAPGPSAELAAELAAVRTDPIAVLAEAAGYDDPERWWEDVVEHQFGARPSDPDHTAQAKPTAQAVTHDRATSSDTAASNTAAPSDAAAVSHMALSGDAVATNDSAATSDSAPVSTTAALTIDSIPATDEEFAAAMAPFAAIAEAMIAVRAAAPQPPEDERVEEDRREAYMRTALRAALKEHERVAVVCGAWHVPALTAPLRPATVDAAVLRGLPKTKVAMTWVPWTHARLASWQGYGAGVRSPGWYHHLFTSPDQLVIERWLVRAANVLRRDGVPVSSAHVIEATRLAEALATMRGRPLAGLAEVTDAAHAALCDGDDLRLKLINRRLVVGDRLGRVPDRTPSVPIARDVASSQKRLRMAPAVSSKELDLDLRREMDLDRSRLLHRLRLLGVEWGELLPLRKGKGTFWESWRLAWQPEFAVDLVEAGAYGTTVRAAATARVLEQAASAAVLADVTGLVERCLLADLPDALPGVLHALDDRMALDADVAHLMDAVPALARTLRYGDVRGTDLTALRAVTEGMTTRICIGLPSAVGGLDDSAATIMRDRIDEVHRAISLLEDDEASGRWFAVLSGLSTRDDLHGLLSGRLTRLLLDGGRVEVTEVGERMSMVLTVGVPVARAAAWIEGFLAGDGLLLVHDERLLGLVDTWLADIPADAFIEVLPLLRRTFSGYPAPQRRMIGDRAAHIGDVPATPGRPGGDDVDELRGVLVLPTVGALLGWSGTTVDSLVRGIDLDAEKEEADA